MKPLKRPIISWKASKQIAGVREKVNAITVYKLDLSFLELSTHLSNHENFNFKLLNIDFFLEFEILDVFWKFYELILEKSTNNFQYRAISVVILLFQDSSGGDTTN